MRTIELLAPAKNLSCAIAAINSGADAVYMGGPSFGARVNAPNTLEDIKAVCDYAHLFGVKVHITLNTILTDEELVKARELSFKLYDAGVDALIIQDLGLINGPLPPLEIHASTQQDNATVQKVEFLEKAGFSQVVLARELSLKQIEEIKAATDVRLECFIHGALCVGVSGRCYLSAAMTGRSANRGECAQLCRVAQSLYTKDGQCLAKDRYLLSMKDLNQSKNLEKLIDAGISSFKIEGRLKDENYVRNVTAYYRKAIDEILKDRDDVTRSSFGNVTANFTPDLNKSFNRSFTAYNTFEQKDNYANFDAPGFVGVKIGTLVSQKGHDLKFKLQKKVELHNGDSLNYFKSDSALEGFRISSVKDSDTAEIFQALPRIESGTVFYRSKDACFEKLLDDKSCIRKLKLDMTYKETADAVELYLKDEMGFEASAKVELEQIQSAKDPDSLSKNLSAKLTKLGDTVYEINSLDFNLQYHHFVPVSLINNMRREAIEKLNLSKLKRRCCVEHHFENAPAIAEHERELGFKANIYNESSKDFYIKHGLLKMEYAFEKEHPKGRVCVLESKHCLRYCFNLCPKRHNVKAKSLYLVIGKRRFDLAFDCVNCRMMLMESV